MLAEVKKETYSKYIVFGVLAGAVVSVCVEIVLRILGMAVPFFLDSWWLVPFIFVVWWGGVKQSLFSISIKGEEAKEKVLFTSSILLILGLTNIDFLFKHEAKSSTIVTIVLLFFGVSFIGRGLYLIGSVFQNKNSDKV